MVLYKLSNQTLVKVRKFSVKLCMIVNFHYLLVVQFENLNEGLSVDLQLVLDQVYYAL